MGLAYRHIDRCSSLDRHWSVVSAERPSNHERCLLFWAVSVGRVLDALYGSKIRTGPGEVRWPFPGAIRFHLVLLRASSPGKA